MNEIKLPLIQIKARNIKKDVDLINLPPDIQQIDPSSIMAYLGCRGIGRNGNAEENVNIANINEYRKNRQLKFDF